MSSERLRSLLAPIHDRAQAFARNLARSHSDGDDLYQEAVMRALVKVGGLRDDGAFKPWFYRVLISVHRNQARRAFWRRLIPFGVSSDGEPDPATSGELGYRMTDWSPDAAMATQRAREALAILPAVQREAIVLFELEGWQVDEIAELHGVSASAIKSRLARGRARLRGYYEGQHAGDGVPDVAPGDTP